MDTDYKELLASLNIDRLTNDELLDLKLGLNDKLKATRNEITKRKEFIVNAKRKEKKAANKKKRGELSVYGSRILSELYLKNKIRKTIIKEMKINGKTYNNSLRVIGHELERDYFTKWKDCPLDGFEFRITGNSTEYNHETGSLFAIRPEVFVDETYPMRRYLDGRYNDQP